MKNYSIIVLIAFLCLLISCSKDDDTPNLPPSEVISISAVTKENTLVTVSWGAAEDPNGDQVYYDVLVNDRSVATKTTNTFVDVDVNQFLSRLKGVTAAELKKGINIDLNIKIQAYDNANNVSDQVEVIRSVFVNRVPGEFEFTNVYFDYYSYNYISIEWSSATDADGDILSYDVYINDILVRDNYVISTDSFDDRGRVDYNQNFFELIKDEIVIKVIADDQSGGLKEISKSYHFTATDVDLGALATPSENDYSYSISSNEPDNKIGYTFSVSESTGIAVIDNNNNGYYRLRDMNGNSIYENYRINVESIEAGNYYLEIENYSGGNGSFTIVFRDAKDTDVDLGALAVPSENSYSYTISPNEPDNKIGHTFSINETTGIAIFDENNSSYYFLTDANGNYIQNGNRIGVETLQPGSYYLEVENYNNTTTENFTITLKDAKETDVDLGALTIPSENEYTYTTTRNEPDHKIAYSFSINETTGFVLIDESFNAYFQLLDASGNYLYGGSDIRIENLESGTYTLEVENYNNNDGLFNIILQDPKATDEDLGVIDTLPYSNSFTFNDIFKEADSRIRYKFELNSQATYNFQTSANVYINLLDAAGNYINGSYNSLSGNTNSAGVYYIEVYTYDNFNDSGTLSISFE